MYTGCTEKIMSDEELAYFYKGIPLDFELHENEYLLIKDDKGRVVDKYCFQEGEYRKVVYATLKNAGTVIKPRNDYQLLAFDMLQDPSTKIKVLTGGPGSGKTMTVFLHAKNLIAKGIYQKIIYIIPNITVKGIPDIGYLKGTQEEKTEWLLNPLKDKCTPGELSYLLETGKLEVVPLPFIRGMSFDRNCIVIVSEAQNTNPYIMKLILSRIGEDCEIFIEGDTTDQVDARIFEDENNGLVRMIESLKGEKLFSYMHLPIVERSDVAKLAQKIV